MDNVFVYPTIARFSWKTCETIANKEAAIIKWSQDDEVLEERYKIKDRSERFQYFALNNMELVEDF
jgi:hypothetical protein